MKPNGCYNRADYAPTTLMTSELGQADPRCIGCSRCAAKLDDPK